MKWNEINNKTKQIKQNKTKFQKTAQKKIKENS